MSDICIQRLNDENEIMCALTTCSPFFYNQDYNSEYWITQLSKKFYMNGNVIAAIRNNQILGVCAYYSNDLINRVSYLSMIIVVGTAQGTGVGKQLLLEMISDCRNNGMHSIRLEVANSNLKAISFYQRNGFVKEQSTSTSSTYYVLFLK